MGFHADVPRSLTDQALRRERLAVEGVELDAGQGAALSRPVQLADLPGDEAPGLAPSGLPGWG